MGLIEEYVAVRGSGRRGVAHDFTSSVVDRARVAFAGADTNGDGFRELQMRGDRAYYESLTREQRISFLNVAIFRLVRAGASITEHALTRVRQPVARAVALNLDEIRDLPARVEEFLPSNAEAASGVERWLWLLAKEFSSQNDEPERYQRLASLHDEEVNALAHYKIKLTASKLLSREEKSEMWAQRRNWSDRHLDRIAYARFANAHADGVAPQPGSTIAALSEDGRSVRAAFLSELRK